MRRDGKTGGFPETFVPCGIAMVVDSLRSLGNYGYRWAVEDVDAAQAQASSSICVRPSRISVKPRLNSRAKPRSQWWNSTGPGRRCASQRVTIDRDGESGIPADVLTDPTGRFAGSMACPRTR
ncbi:hypothetical protein GCM10009624_07930 [Gordonia sinesedis]